MTGFQLGLKFLLYFIWCPNPSPEDQARPPKSGRIYKKGCQALLEDPMDKVLIIDTAFEDLDHSLVKRYFDNTQESLMKDPLVVKDGALYGARCVRVLTILGGSWGEMPEYLKPTLWPCGQLPPKEEPYPQDVSTFKTHSLLQDMRKFFKTEDIKEVRVAQPIVQSCLWNLTIVVWGRSKQQITQECYDEAVRLWVEQRTKFNLPSSVAI